jgi:hypothetical protein
MNAVSVGDEPARPFSRGMGLINQIVGGTVFLSSFCLCCVLSFLFLPDDESVAMPVPILASTLVLMTTLVGAAALATFGLGMQADRGWRPSFGATATSAVMVVLYVLAFAGVFGPRSDPSFLPLFSSGLCLVSLILAIVNLAALGEVLRHPPASSAPPTVRSEDFPDPWAEKKERLDSPTRDAIAKRRRKLEREIEQIDRLEKSMDDDQAG